MSYCIVIVKNQSLLLLLVSAMTKGTTGDRSTLFLLLMAILSTVESITHPSHVGSAVVGGSEMAGVKIVGVFSDLSEKKFYGPGIVRQYPGSGCAELDEIKFCLFFVICECESEYLGK